MNKLFQYFIKYLIPALVMFCLAFFSGSQQHPIFGMVGFVAFFTAGVFLIIEGRNKHFKN